MIWKSERSLADKAFEHIKAVVKLSALDYLMQENPYSATIKIRKKYLNDFSATQQATSSPVYSPPCQNTSPTISQSDSGIFEDNINHLEDESKKKVSKLLHKMEEKDNEIDQLKLHIIEIENAIGERIKRSLKNLENAEEWLNEIINTTLNDSALEKLKLNLTETKTNLKKKREREGRKKKQTKKGAE